MKRTLTALLLILILIFPAQADQVSDLMKEAESLYADRENVKSCEKSIELYEKALELDPNNYDACWKASMSCKWLGDKYPKGKRIKILEKGEKFARKAIEINPDDVEGHFRLGVSMGRIGEERGVLNSLFMIGPIRDEMEKVLKIDPEHDGAHFVLGSLYRQAPGWPLSCGDLNKALHHAELAVKYSPSTILNHVGLAEVYFDKDRYKEAREELLFAIEMPFEDDMIPEGKDDKEKARELLKRVNEVLGIIE